MYEMVILSFLMRQPMHGYLIAKIINDMIGPFARLSNGRLYPLLGKLEADGLIAVVDREPTQRADRRHRAYEITETGRERFYQLMMDTTSNPGDYQRIFWYKLPFLELLSPEERLYLLDHYINFAQTHLYHVRHEMEDLRHKARMGQLADDAMTPSWLDATLLAMGHLEKQWELEREFATACRSSEMANREGTTGDEPPPGSAAGTADEHIDGRSPS